MLNVAIVTPIYNTQDYLHKCINSVLSQKGVTFEYILIDDGSTDNSLEIARHYAERDDRITLISKKNEGQGIARNIGIKIANAEYIYFVDSDDSLGAGTLSTLYNTAKKHGLDICSPGVPGHYFSKPLEHIACLPCKSQFIKLNIIKRNRILQPSVSSGQDGVFSHLVLAHTDRIGMNSDAKFNYTHAREGSTFAKHLKRHDLIPSIIDQHYEAIEDHYNAHDLWSRNALRLLNFVADETLRNRLSPHFEKLSVEQRKTVLRRVQGVVKKAIGHVHDGDQKMVPASVNALYALNLNQDIDSFGKRIADKEEPVKFKVNENFSEGAVTVCKYSNKVYKPVAPKAAHTSSVSQPLAAPLKHVAPASSSQSNSKELISKLDFIVNTINNSTVQLKSAIRGGASTLTDGEESLVASVTTLPSRLPLVHLALESIFAQTVKPSKVVLWLSDETNPALVETAELSALQRKGLDIRFVKDVGPHTKLMYALEAFPDKAIVTFDDDIMYPINMIQSLWIQHKVFPDAVISNWARELAFDEFGKVLGVRSGRLLTPANLDQDIEQAKRYEPKPTLKGFPYGTSGVLYPPGSLSQRVFEVETFRRLCPKEDDIWFRAMGILNGTPIVPTNLGINPKHHCITGSQVEALRHDNHGLKQNQIQMQRVFDELDLYSLL